MAEPTAATWVAKADALAKANKRTEALAAYGKALKLDPDCKPALFGAAMMLVELGNEAEARKAAGRFIRLAGPDDAPKVKALRMLVRLPAYKKLAEHAAKTAEAWEEEVVIEVTAVADGDLPLSREIEDNVVAVPAAKSGLVEAEVRRCGERVEIFLKTGNYAGAARAYHDAMKRAPGHPDLVAGYAVCLIRLGRAAEVLPMLDDAVRRHPRHADLQFARGLALREADRIEEAVASFDLAARIGNDIQAWHGKGVCLADLDRLPEAREAFAEAMKRRPRHVESVLGLATVCVRMGDWEEALRLTERALKIDANSVDAWLTRGRAYRAAHQPRQARTCFDKALALDPGNPEAIQARSAEC